MQDAEKFTAFCAEFALQPISQTKDGQTLYGFLNKGNESGLPTLGYNEQTASWEPIDFLRQLAEHLLPEYVAVILEIGSEKLRYLIGEAFAVNAAGQTVMLTPEEIYPRAAALGSSCTSCAY